MCETQGSDRWKELLGLSGDSIRWGCALAFLVALMVAWCQGGLLRTAEPWQTANPVLSLDWLLVDVTIFTPLWALCIVMGFRLLRQWTAVVVTPLVYAVFSIAVLSLLRRVEGGSFFAGWGLGAFDVLMSYFSLAFFLLGILLALRWMKSQWVALAVGYWVGRLPMVAVRRLGEWLLLRSSSVHIAPMDIRREAYFIFVSLVEAVLWAGLFYAGREIAWAAKGRVSKRFYLTSVVGAIQGGATALMVFPFLRTSTPAMMALAITFLALLIYCALVMLMWLHKMWAAIQDGHARATPRQAVGFLFIPLFNFYWAFQAFWGFAKDYNRYLERRALPGRRLAAGVFLAYTILCFGGAIPFVGVLVVEVNSLLAAVMIAQSCDAVNALPAEPAAALAA